MIRRTFKTPCRMKGALGAMLALLAAAATAGTATRTTAYDYSTASGRLIKEIIEPGDAQLCLARVYTPDAFGRTQGVLARNCNASAGTFAGSGASVNTEAAAPPSGSLALFANRSRSDVYTQLSDGRLQVVSTNAASDTETRIYSADHGQLISLTGPNGLTTQWAYDSLGRKTLERRADGTGTRWTYAYCAGINGGAQSCPTVGTGAAAYVVTEIPVTAPIDIAAQTSGSANGASTTIYFDALNRVIRRETQGFDGTAILEDSSHDAQGHLATTTRPYYANQSAYTWTRRYDPLDRVVEIKAPDSSSTTITYQGLYTIVLDNLGRATTTGRDVWGRPATITDTNGKTLTHRYDPFGNLLSSTDSAGNALAMQYDGRGRKIAAQDPDQGSWSWAYNAAGDLVQQTDAKSQITTLGYDTLGRLVSRSEPSLNANWYYGTFADGKTACSTGKGKLCEATSDNGYSRKHNYDSLGRPSTIDTQLGSVTYNQGWSYDANSRVLDESYPVVSGSTRLVVRRGYNARGYLTKLSNANTSDTYWQATAMDAEQRLTQTSLGNGLNTTQVFAPDTGRLTFLVTPGVLNYGHSYYSVAGTLKIRNDAASGVDASYTFDTLNRLQKETLIGSAVPAEQNISWGIDAIGNITSRSDQGTYAYSKATGGGPHAISGVTGSVNGVTNPSYSYDANGNLTGMTASAGSRSVVWNSFNRATSVTLTASGVSNAVTLLYGPEHDRVRVISTRGGVPQRTTTYLNPGAGEGLFYEEEQNHVSGTTLKRHYLSDGERTIGVVTWNGSAWSTQYWHADALGSVVAVTDAAGTVVERMAYEPFGKRRNLNGTTDLLGALTATSTQRGFTEHEHLDTVGLINMNGRLYDPALARFLGVDPIIQAPRNQQAMNAYAYAFNDPLGYVDPSGFCADAYINPFNGQCLTSGSSTVFDQYAWLRKSLADELQRQQAAARVSTPAATSTSTTTKVLNYTQMVLTGASVIPGLNIPAGGLSTAIDVFQGNWGEAAISLATMVPLVGEGAVALKAERLAARVAAEAVEEAGALAAKESKTLFHYTDAAGAKGIAESGVIRPDAKGRVFLTEQRLSPADVTDRLFIGRSGDKGSHLVEIRVPADLPIRQGKNANELIHQGTLRDGRQGSFTVRPNDF